MSIHKYSTNADSNLSVGDGSEAVSIAEGMARGDVNNAMRAMAADTAKHYKDSGSLISTGTATALEVATLSDISALANGLHLTFKAHIAVGEAATLNVNGLGARDLYLNTPDGLVAMESEVFPSGSYLQVIYDGARWVCVNGRPRYDDIIGDDLVSQFARPAPLAPSALIKKGQVFELYSPLSVSGFWALDILEADTSAMRRPVERRVVELADLYHQIFDGFTNSGTFTRIANSASFGGAYNGTTTVGDYVEKQITLSGGSNQVKIGYASRNSANHISVTIDGGTALVNMLPTNAAGEKYVDAYDAGATIPNVNQTALIAALPAGTYTIRMTNSAERNAFAVAGNTMYPQAILATGGGAGLPGGDKTHAPTWANGEAVLSTDQRWWEGVTYRATNSGTTSGTSPLDDTGVTWAVVADTYATFNEKYLVDISEPTWAAWLSVNGQPEEDFGGDIHGGVTLTETEVLADGLVVSPPDYTAIYASEITVKQKATAAHTGDPSTVIADLEMIFGCVPGGVFPYANRITPRSTALLGLYYPAMMPLYHYYADGFVYLVRRCLAQGKGAAKPSDYYGQANPAFGAGNGLQLMALVELGSPRGAGGVPAVDKEGRFIAAVSLEVTRDTMLNFENDGARSFWDMNTGGSDPSGGGYSGSALKAYFRAKTGDVKKTIAAGEHIQARGVYRVSLQSGTVADF